jgi:hypothetical protein
MQCSWYGVSEVVVLLIKEGAGVNLVNDVSATSIPSLLLYSYRSRDISPAILFKHRSAVRQH